MLIKDLEEAASVRAAEAGFGTVTSVFIVNSVHQMIPWFIAAFSFVLCNLVVGILLKCAADGKVDFWCQIRNALADMVLYYSIIVMCCMFNEATHGVHNIDYWGCLGVFGIEFVKIYVKVLKLRRLSVDWKKLAPLLMKKMFGCGNAEEFTDLIKSDDDENSKE